MPLQGEYVPSASEWVRNQVEQYEASDGAEGGTMKGLPVVILTTMGATSGKIRKTPVMRVEHGGEYLAVASMGGAPTNPSWYHNLVAHPLVEVQDGSARRDYTARLLEGGERDAWWERAVAAFPDYAEYQKKTDREIPLFLLTPVDEAS